MKPNQRKLLGLESIQRSVQGIVIILGHWKAHFTPFNFPLIHWLPPHVTANAAAPQT